MLLYVHLPSVPPEVRWGHLSTAESRGRGPILNGAHSLCASSTLGCVYISSGSGQLGPGFCLTEGPQGVGGGRAEEDASPGTSVTVKENENSAASPLRCLPTLAQTGPRGRPGQGGARVLCLVPCQSTGASCQQLLSVPSPEAREAATGFWMGQMAGDRLGGTAE